MLLPGARIQLTMMDRGRIALPTLVRPDCCGDEDLQGGRVGGHVWRHRWHHHL